ncbi:MAG: acetyl-CoA carboxylase, carboxyltransferase subunit beta [Armatimonadota bacterium]|nr:acetyl-CoA carboxylase, carboxyltransferase subunit beta [bacterium]MCS7309865.1 acetyl-CoA carboxylase, carboxyltransferase subunit beta [Armatimonadota bacterium]MDW8105456.1 acetyl-CoA carboxylase, carboxyltransferase subunit beta [Armatimonadota bacterium]MDW8289884.1 acetyl-CoA carboxylase, carboxyltransferase subunit beta [Armatimonadota bacterium]
MRKGWFGRQNAAQKVVLEEMNDAWVKCNGCQQILFARDFERNLKVCPRCGHHHRLSARERIALLADPDTFVERDAEIVSDDPLGFPEYADKLQKGRSNSGLPEAIVSGTCTLSGIPIVLAVMDFAFMGGSMGSAVGEKVARAMEHALEQRLPIVICSTSGGARMQEGLLSLMQMAKTCAAAARLHEAAVPYVSVLTDPTMAGVLASYASVGDVVIAEPGALVGFAGQRVAQQAQVVKPPPNFQTAEFQLEHGMVDLIVPRKELKYTLHKVLRFFVGG